MISALTERKTISPVGTISLAGSRTAIPDVGGNGSVDVDSELYGIVKYASDWIDFGATGENEIYQNVKYILLTPIRSVVLDREFGFDFSMVDKPIPVAELMYSQEAAMKIALYEPRCFFEKTDYEEDYLNGHLNPSTQIAITSIDESPSLYPSESAIDGTILTGGTPFVSPAELTAFFRGTLGGTQGAQGPPGPPGQDGIIGQDGKNGINAFTTLTANLTVPPVGQTVDATVVESGWVVVGQIVYVQGAAGSGQAGAFKVNNKNGNVLTLLNVPQSSGGGSVGSLAMVWGETPTGNIDGTNKDYISGYPFQPNSLAVFLNGSRQRRIQDYTETSNQSFSFVNPPLVGDSLSIDYNKF